MNAYREFWNTVIFGNDALGPGGIERYWYTIALVALLFFAIGIASGRVRLLAPAATAAVAVAYVVALVPFMVWTASCTGCGSSISYDTARSGELPFLHMAWAGVFTMGLATLWLGVLVSRGFAALSGLRAAPPGREAGAP